MPMGKTTIFVFIFGSVLNINFAKAENRDKVRVPKQSNNNPTFFWCAKTDGNTHIGYCFEKQKQCKDWSRKKFEENGKKLHLCRPTKL